MRVGTGTRRRAVTGPQQTRAGSLASLVALKMPAPATPGQSRVVSLNFPALPDGAFKFRLEDWLSARHAHPARSQDVEIGTFQRTQTVEHSAEFGFGGFHTELSIRKRAHRQSLVAVSLAGYVRRQAFRPVVPSG